MAWLSRQKEKQDFSTCLSAQGREWNDSSLNCGMIEMLQCRYANCDLSQVRAVENLRKIEDRVGAGPLVCGLAGWGRF